MSSPPPARLRGIGDRAGHGANSSAVEFGASDSFMLTLDGKPRLVRLVPWSLRDRVHVEGDPLGLVDRRERLWRGTVGL